ncbi:hypothetical protein [Dysosmobacter sp.]|uniref:hypothetical protein n=1 Tax=Dysosmobacter sp. TaxID=2591382 RepID=UPI002A9245D5|nr:hypothetical protein [Dysosmobacter sp.]MDY5612612.1 hypothetical protein [Dysosmobacter sp.]
MQTISDWCAVVIQQVRFWPDHKSIELELRNHYIDHVRDLERIGFESRLAEERALLAMGDPIEVGKAMDKAHKPWLGRIWIASIVFLLFAFVWFAVDLGDSQVFARARNSFFPVEDIGMYETFTNGYYEIYDHMGVLTADDVLQLGDYTVSLVKGDWWYCNDKYYTAYCLFRIEEDGLWFDMPTELMDDFRMFTDTGQEFTNTKEAGNSYERKDFTEEMEKHWFIINQASNDKLVPDKPNTVRSESADDLRGGYLIMMISTWERPKWTELSYPFGGNDDVLWICWEVAP